MEKPKDIRPCLICKKALTGSVTTSFPLSQDFFIENKFVLSFIQKEIEKYDADPLDRLCLSCYKNAENWRDESENHFDYEELETITDVIDTCMDAEIKTEPDDPLMPAEGIDFNKVELSTSISIPGYARLPHSRTKCLMKDCQNKDLKPISSMKRSEILAEQCLFLGTRIRICDKHVNVNKWDKNLIDKVRYLMHDFSEAQIMDMIKLLKVKKSYFSDFVDNVGRDDDDDE